MPQSATEKEADGKEFEVERSPNLGLVPMVAKLVNGFIGPQGRLVFIVETAYVSNPDFRDWKDAPTDFQSTLIEVFSTEAAARACLRKEMADKILAARNIWPDRDHAHWDEHGNDATWGEFYCHGGTNEDKESAIQALRRGNDGAEDKFEFPWSEDSDSTQLVLLSTCCGFLHRISRGDDEIDDDRDEVSSMYHWYCDEDWGDTFVIRAVLVK